MIQHHYTCYGMHISSTFPCPELRETIEASVPDIKISEGETPQELDNATRRAARFSIAPQQLLLEVDGIARFWVRNGRDITVQRVPHASFDDVRVFLYGTAFGAALLQQGRVPLHATTVTKCGQTVAFAGPSGAGKSTLAYTLLQRGWKLVADDVSVLTPIDGKLHVQPAFPSVKLWRDVLEASQANFSQLPQIRAEFDKYRWTAKDCFHHAPALLTAIIGLLPSDEDEIEIELLKGAKKFKYLTQQTYRRQMIKGMTDSSQIFSIWTQTLDQVDLWHIQRPKSPMNPQPIADAVENLLP